MSRRADRQRLDDDQNRRREAIAWLLDHQPADPLLALAYWSDVADAAQEQMNDAAVRAHRAGHSYGVLGMAYGDRTQGAAHSRFARHIADAQA